MYADLARVRYEQKTFDSYEIAVIEYLPCFPSLVGFGIGLAVIPCEGELPSFGVNLQLFTAICQMNKIAANWSRDAAGNTYHAKGLENLVELIFYLGRRPRSRLRNTRAKSKIRTSPAASNFLAANSGEVCR